MPTLQWLRCVGRSLSLTLVGGVLWLVVAAASLVVCFAGLFGLLVGAGWLWLRTPRLLALTAEGFGCAAAGFLVAGAAAAAAETVRALRFRLDPAAERRAYVRHYYRLPRVVHAPRQW